MTSFESDDPRNNPVTISATPPSEASHDVESVHCTAHRDDENAWSCFLDQLRSRGPTFSRYERRGEIGRGGMGVVYRVFDVDARRELAMKVILEPQGDESTSGSNRLDSRTLGRFLEEAQVTGQLDHPGIVPVHEIGVDPLDHVYFTMKLVKGEDLRTIFDKVRAGVDGWSVPRAIGVLIKVCEAMEFSHTKGVIHRDLKPSNVMVGRFGEAYVMDWGLARIVDDDGENPLRRNRSFLDPDASTIRSERKVIAASDTGSSLITLDGDVVGTPSYMSPEQARGQLSSVGPASDIYSLGAMLYHLLAGHPPYRDISDQLAGHQVTSLVLVGPPRRLSDIAPHAPPELIAIQEKAMSREAHVRYPTMAALADDLRAWLENRVVSAYDHGVFERTRKWMGRNRALASTALGALVTIGVLTGFYLESLFERETRARTEATRADRNAREAERNAIEAKKREREVVAAHESVLRLADAKRFEVLVREWDELWPANPEQTPQLRDWLARARELVARRADHEATLATLRQSHRALPHARDDEFETLRAAGRHQEAAALARQIAAERAFDFGADTEAQWWHDTLRALVRDISTLEVAEMFAPTIASMEARLRFAETVHTRTVTDRASDWTSAAKRVAASPTYRGLSLEPQLGLLPLGPDPDSGLEEFAMLQSGDVPVRERSTGRLAIGEASAIVFVLIPGGETTLGAQSSDPNAPRFDPTADAVDLDGPTVSLDAYFLGKHEVTQAQWQRFFGENPSYYRDGFVNKGVAVTASNPVEQVDFPSLERLVRRLGNGVSIPTCAQWEHAARGGVVTRWAHGQDTAGLDRFANLADVYCRDHGGPASWVYDDDLDDGFALHAPVGSLAPNGFGLHDMIGNVWEWCLEPDVDYRTCSVTPGTGELTHPTAESGQHVTRGGAFNEPSSVVGIAARMEQSSNERDTNLGVRLARRLAR